MPGRRTAAGLHFGESELASRLSTKPAFVDLVVTRWQAKRPALETFINSSIDSYTLRLQEAQQRNFERWPILGMQMSNYYTWTTYDQEVRFLRSFLNERMAWLDRAYASAESFQRSVSSRPTDRPH